MRRIQVLGDRILAQLVAGNDNKKHFVGRYLEVNIQKLKLYLGLNFVFILI